jgi:hypothetical protein
LHTRLGQCGRSADHLVRVGRTLDPVSQYRGIVGPPRGAHNAGWETGTTQRREARRSYWPAGPGLPESGRQLLAQIMPAPNRSRRTSAMNPGTEAPRRLGSAPSPAGWHARRPVAPSA